MFILSTKLPKKISVLIVLEYAI